MRRLTLALALGLGLASGACTLHESAPLADPLAKTGNPKYDDFLGAVRLLCDEAHKAASDLDVGHGDLVKALALGSGANSGAAIDAVGSRAKKLQDKGVLLHLEIAPEPKVIASRGKVAVGPDGEALFKAVEATLRSSLDVRRKLGTLALRAAELEKRRAELRDQVPDVFKDETPARRDDISSELDRVKGMLATATDDASRAAGAESRFVVDLVYAAETGGGAHPEAASTKPPPRSRGSRTGVAAARVTGADGAAPPPKKKPKSGDDFEP